MNLRKIERRGRDGSPAPLARRADLLDEQNRLEGDPYRFSAGAAAFSSLRGLTLPGMTPSPMRWRAVICAE